MWRVDAITGGCGVRETSRAPAAGELGCSKWRPSSRLCTAVGFQISKKPVGTCVRVKYGVWEWEWEFGIVSQVPLQLDRLNTQTSMHTLWDATDVSGTQAQPTSQPRSLFLLTNRSYIVHIWPHGGSTAVRLHACWCNLLHAAAGTAAAAGRH